MFNKDILAKKNKEQRNKLKATRDKKNSCKCHNMENFLGAEKMSPVTFQWKAREMF